MTTRRLALSALALLCSTLALPHPSAAKPPRAARAKTVPAGPIELKLAPFAGPLRTVSGKIGELTGSFLFDTGGGGTILTLETAKALKLEPFGRLTGFRHDGGRLDVQRGGPVDLALGGFRRHGEVGIFDLTPLLAGLPPVAGIVSLETFAGRAITLDLKNDRLIVETPASLAARVKKARALQVRFERQAGGATLDLHVAIEGKHGPLWFELDSGNVAPVLLAPHAYAELGFEAPPAEQTQSVELPIAGLGPVRCNVFTKEMIYDGLLNAEFMGRFVITLDLEHERAWAQPNP